MVEDQFDPAAIALRYLNANSERLIDVVSKGIKERADRVRARTKSTYQTYVANISRQYGRGKSFFVRSEPLPLYSIFVPMDLATQHRAISRASLTDLVAITHHIVIAGLGGSGKTMMMRHFLLNSLAGDGKLPVFVELRQLNRDPKSLRAAILSVLGAHGLDVDEHFLEAALRAGQFLFLLDGFDELNSDFRSVLAEEVRDLSTRYPDNWFVLSSRPDIELNALEDFTIFQMQPLDMEAAIALVQKVPFEDPVKVRFVEDLKNGLFESHTSFLSNPLLLSIMLLTYSDVANIPTKLSLFYEQAYEALFQKHDALKGGFQRERRTALDIQDFARAFSGFCVLSYGENTFEFSRTVALDMLDRSSALTQLDYGSSDFLADLLQAVCLLVEDGWTMTFAHRSFQEYFAARFVSRLSNNQAKEALIRQFAANASRDSVIFLMYEMDPEVIERSYILPEIERLRTLIPSDDPTTAQARHAFVGLMFDSFIIDQGDGEPAAISALLGRDPRLLDFVMYATRQFPDLRGDKVLPGGTSAVAGKLLRGKRTQIRLDEVEPDSDTFAQLGQDQAFFAGQTLQRLYALADELKAKHATLDTSLGALLAEARPRLPRPVATQRRLAPRRARRKT